MKLGRQWVSYHSVFKLPIPYDNCIGVPISRSRPFQPEKALVGGFSVIVKTGCGTDGALHSTSLKVVSTSAARGSAYGSLRAGELTYTLEAASGGGTVLYSRQRDWFMQFEQEQDTSLYDLEDLFR